MGRSGDVHEVFGHVEDLSELLDESGVESTLHETEIDSVLGVHLIEDFDVLAQSLGDVLLSLVDVDDAEAISKLVVANVEDGLVEHRKFVRLGEEDHLLLVDALDGVDEVLTEQTTQRRAVEPLEDASTGQHCDDNDERDREVHGEVLEVNDVEDDVTDEGRDDKGQADDDDGHRGVVEARQTRTLKLEQQVTNGEEREYTQECNSVHSREGDGVAVDDDDETRSEQEEDEDDPMIRTAELVLVEQELRQAAIECHTTNETIDSDIRGEDGTGQDQNRVNTHNDFQPVANRDAGDLTQDQELVVRVRSVRDGDEGSSEEGQERVEDSDDCGHVAQSLGEDSVGLLLNVVRARFESRDSKKACAETKEDVGRYASNGGQIPVFLEHARSIDRNRRDAHSRDDDERDQVHHEQHEGYSSALTDTEDSQASEDEEHTCKF